MQPRIYPLGLRIADLSNSLSFTVADVEYLNVI